MTKLEWLEQVGIGFDQWVNTWFKGYADETISARAYRNRKTKKRWRALRKLIDWVFFFWQDDHCMRAWLSENQRRHLPRSYR